MAALSWRTSLRACRAIVSAEEVLARLRLGTSFLVILRLTAMIEAGAVEAKSDLAYADAETDGEDGGSGYEKVLVSVLE